MSHFILLDRDEIVASDIYDMQLKAIADLQSYLDSSIGDNRVSIITPDIHTIMDQLVDFVREIKKIAL